MARKKRDSKDSEKNLFLDALIKLGIPRETAEEMWQISSTPEGQRQLMSLMQEMDEEAPAQDDPWHNLGLSPQQREAVRWTEMARDAQTQEEFVERLRRAAAAWPLCPDIPLVVSEFAPDNAAAIQHVDRAVATARELLATAEEGRSVMSECYFLCFSLLRRATLQWDMVRGDDAIRDLIEVLAYNHPLFPEAAEYLLNYLLISQRDEEAAQIAAHPYACSQNASWKYSKALSEFRRGNLDQASQTLSAAYQQNPLIAEGLAGYRDVENQAAKEFDPDAPIHRTAQYCGLARRGWKDSLGALRWMRETLQLEAPQSPKGKSRTVHGWKKLRQQLQGLDQVQSEEWEVGCLPPVSPVESAAADQQDSGWTLIALRKDAYQVLDALTSAEKPRLPDVLKWLTSNMLRPAQGDPRRPAKVWFTDAKLATKLASKLDEIGVDCAFTPDSPALQHCARVIENTVRSSRCPQVEDLNLDELRTLPLVDEVWQVDHFRMATFISDDVSSRRPWLTMVGDSTNELAMQQEFVEEEPGPGRGAAVLLAAMSKPTCGNRRRPTEVQVCRPTLLEELTPVLSQLGVRCSLLDSLPFLAEFIRGLTQSLAGDGAVTGLLDSPGITPELVADTFLAAAQFYRDAPWRNIPGEVPIRLVSSSLEGGPLYAIVMGRAGLSKGLAVYDDLSFLRKMIRGELSENQMRRGNVPLVVDFSDEDDFPPVDLYDQERFGWEVANPEAYPMIMRVNPGQNVRRPFAWELRVLQGALLAIPPFVGNPSQGKHSYKIETSDGPLELTLDWCD